MGAIIEVEKLVRRFAGAKALDGIDLKIAEGEAFALLGPNGAGKTTLVRVLSTLLRPTSGKVRVCGLALPDEREEVKKRIGLVSHNPFLYSELTAAENLAFYAELYGVDIDVEALLARVCLNHRSEDLVGTFSQGMRQRLSIARALLHGPKILILDEPTAGLDLQSRSDFYAMVKDLHARGGTIILATHNLEEASYLCTRAAVLNKGKVETILDLRGETAGAEEALGRLR
ncbi:MAG: heme ABC exporter ATP-binding protein CcmA [Candidatus Hydrothermarchaeota archaeon]